MQSGLPAVECLGAAAPLASSVVKNRSVDGPPDRRFSYCGSQDKFIDLLNLSQVRMAHGNYNAKQIVDYCPSQKLHRATIPGRTATRN
jgi:hypothetical protein